MKEIRDSRTIQQSWRRGSVRDVASVFGQTITEGNEPQFSISEKDRELYDAKKAVVKQLDDKKLAEYVKFRVENELIAAKKTVEELDAELNKLRNNIKSQSTNFHLPEEIKGVQAFRDHDDVKRELQSTKQELRKLKQDISYALEAKSNAEKQIEDSVEHATVNSFIEEDLRIKIIEAYEEHVLVELARIEAEKELRSIQADRQSNASRYSETAKGIRKKILQLEYDLSYSKDIESTLQITNSEIDILQHELLFIKTMNTTNSKNFQSNDRVSETMPKTEEESNAMSKLGSIKKELKAAEEDLERLRGDGFWYMTVIDKIRIEQAGIVQEITSLKESTKTKEFKIKELKLKLDETKKELKDAEISEETTNLVFSNLCAALAKLNIDEEEAKTQKLMHDTEIREIESDMEKAIKTEKRLEEATNELKKMKLKEASALESLRILSEKAMNSRALQSKKNSCINLSDFEFQYLRKHAEEADEIANKKAEAARAWAESIRLEENKTKMRTEILSEEIEELKKSVEKELNEAVKLLSSKKEIEDKLNMFLCRDKPIEARKSVRIEEAMVKEYSKREAKMPTSLWITKVHGMPSPTGKQSPYFAMKKNRRLMMVPMFTWLFKKKKFEKYLKR